MQPAIAVDFDGTLCEHAFPHIGKPKPKTIDYVKNLKSQGWVLILWTCREDIPGNDYLTQAVKWCEEQGLVFDYINEYPNPEFKGFASRKVCASIYLDDRALNVMDI